jgi:hypothetical protein
MAKQGMGQDKDPQVPAQAEQATVNSILNLAEGAVKPDVPSDRMQGGSDFGDMPPQSQPPNIMSGMDNIINAIKADPIKTALAVAALYALLSNGNIFSKGIKTPLVAGATFVALKMFLGSPEKAANHKASNAISSIGKMMAATIAGAISSQAAMAGSIGGPGGTLLAEGIKRGLA